MHNTMRDSADAGLFLSTVGSIRCNLTAFTQTSHVSISYIHASSSLPRGTLTVLSAPMYRSPYPWCRGIENQPRGYPAFCQGLESATNRLTAEVADRYGEVKILHHQRYTR